MVCIPRTLTGGESWCKLGLGERVGSCLSAYDHDNTDTESHPGPAQVLIQSSVTQDTANMKLFKIFKKKPPTSASPGQASNLVCNIHWAEVQ